MRYATVSAARPSFADGAFALLALGATDKDTDVRIAALQQLKLFGDKRAVLHIAPFLDDVKVQQYEVRDNIKLAWRNCDTAVQALEKIINGKSIVTRKGSQEDQDRAVEQWRQWWKDNGEKFTKELDVEPELKRPNK